MTKPFNIISAMETAVEAAVETHRLHKATIKANVAFVSESLSQHGYLGAVCVFDRTDPASEQKNYVALTLAGASIVEIYTIGDRLNPKQTVILSLPSAEQNLPQAVKLPIQQAVRHVSDQIVDHHYRDDPDACDLASGRIVHIIEPRIDNDDLTFRVIVDLDTKKKES